MDDTDATDSYNSPELQHIRDLFLQRHYRQCIRACYAALNSQTREVQPSSIPLASITFYLALAHDELARAMHEFSQFKIPTFHQAAQSYRQALDTLPITSQGLYIPSDDSATSTGPGSSSYTARSDAGSTASTTTARAMYGLQTGASVSAISRSGSSPARAWTDRRGTESIPSPTGFRSSAASECDDLDSHDSYGGIMTPNRILPRDFSSISLLDTPTNRHSTLPKAVSHSLLRPIRPGSPPRADQPRTNQPISRPNAATSMLPKLTIVTSSRRPAQYVLPGDYSPTSPVSPVSPLEDNVWTSDCSDVSPITPSTPELPTVPPLSEDKSLLKTSGGPLHYTSSSQLTTSTERQHHRIDDNLAAIRIQLQTHLQLVERAKSRALAVQTERSASRADRSQNPSEDSQHKQKSTHIAGTFQLNKQPIQQARSFWSFTPPNQKAAEIDTRIQQGRARNWERQRFDPSRYRELAEQALAEL